MVVIEIIGAEGKTPRFERADTAIIRIGRALDNDVIIDDPYIDAHHVVIDVSEPGEWHVTDLSSKNGTLKGHDTIDSAGIVSGDELLVGKTRVRCFSVDHRVPEAKSLKDLEHRLLSFDSPGAMILLMLLLGALPCAAFYLNSFGHALEPDEFVVAASSLLGSSVVIAGFWSLIARLLRGESRFRVLLNITMVAGLVSALLRPLIGVISYNFPGAGVDSVANLLVSAALGGIYIYFVLLLSTRLTSPFSQAIAVVLATGTIAAFAITEYSSRSDFQSYPQYDGTVYAPAFLMRRGDTPREFRLQLPGVFARADALATKQQDDSG